MTIPKSTLNTFINSISATPEAELIFIAEGEKIHPDYHVTEVKLANMRGLDCGRQTSEWNETLIQLLDGPKTHSVNSQFMTAGKFKYIALAGRKTLPLKDDSKLYFEFANQNGTLRKLTVQNIEIRNNQIIVNLGGVLALCKPALRARKATNKVSNACCA